jgi:hypothetical protein
LRQLRRSIKPQFHARGDDYRVTLLGRCRPDGIWEGRVSFKPVGGGGVVLKTPVESTQPNEQELVRWAEGLGSAFFEGAAQSSLSNVKVW